tara:strand:- start:12688 stop:12918 length:231 start_codon:yes stop_codon:yes gene_type:complete
MKKMRKVKDGGAMPPCLIDGSGGYNFGGLRPITKNTTDKIRPTTKRIQATSDATAATPVRPSTPATIATTRKIKAQ